MTEVGEGAAPLLLSMLCLSLMGRMDGAGDVLPLIEQARRHLAQAGDAKT